MRTQYLDAPATGTGQHGPPIADARCFLRLRFHLLGGFENFVDRALHVEGLLRDGVVLAIDDFLEAADGIGDLDVLAGEASELLGNVEGLRQEALNLTGARHCELLLFRKFVNAENGDDVLKILVGLQGTLDALRHIVVLLTDDARIENARGGGQGIDGRDRCRFPSGRG